MEKSKYQFRHLARVVIEAATPLAIGSGDKEIVSDAMVATDVNGLPYIPGSSVAGVVRSMMDPDKQSVFFGYQRGDSDSHGAEIIFSEGRILNSQGKVIDGLDFSRSFEKDNLLKHYSNLPIRQHVRITHKGVADTDKNGKFDNQVCFAGTRFCFEIEVLSDKDKSTDFKQVLQSIHRNTFRLGGGTRKGYGAIEVQSVKVCTINLADEKDLTSYLEKTSDLAESENWRGWQNASSELSMPTEDDKWDEITLTIKPDNFFSFGSGFGDDEGVADMTPVRARKVSWANDGRLSNMYVLIPASSVKGAISHRVAYHYNKAKGIFASTKIVSNDNSDTNDDNPAVRTLFGYMEKGEPKQRGNVLISDVFEPEPDYDKIIKLINHVAIDRFTGGAIDGALFTEQTLYERGKEFKLKILVNKNSFCDQTDNKGNVVVDGKSVKKAFFDTLDDICNGMLPLGGGVNRGNGVFSGSYTTKSDEL